MIQKIISLQTSQSQRSDQVWANQTKSLANRVTLSNMHTPLIQTKLTINKPGDKYEQEADRVADQVMRMPDTEQTVQRKCAECKKEDEEKLQRKPLISYTTPVVQRQTENEEDDEELLQMKENSHGLSPQASPHFQNSLNSVLNQGGRPLSQTDRVFFEPRFGADFSNVRIYDNSQAAKAARQINARAFTLGRDVIFGSSQYSSGNRTSRSLMSHELTHVLQQNILSNKTIQRTIGDGHDLSSPRFVSDTKLQDLYDGNGTLKKGDKNESVRKVQHAIHDSGILFLGHGIDGKFGKLTEKYVKRFQRRNRIASDPSGEVGDETIEKLDQLFPATPLPSDATSSFKFPSMLRILCGWNSAMIKDLRNLYVQLVADLQWADERFNGSSWVPDPTDGDAATIGHTIIIATDNTNENVAKALYHEYQHARAPYVYRRRSWGDEEKYAFRVETDWAINRGITPDPGLTTTNPATGVTTTDPSGISSTVESYPGLDTANPGEVIGKVGANRVRVLLPNNNRIIRNAVNNDTVPGKRVTKPPKRNVKKREWRC